MNASEPNIFVARQPIFKRNKEVFAYELLFRSGLNNYFDPMQDGEEATSKVITNSFLLIGIAAITEGKKAFINFSEEMLLKGYPSLFPKEIAVVCNGHGRQLILSGLFNQFLYPYSPIKKAIVCMQMKRDIIGMHTKF